MNRFDAPEELCFAAIFRPTFFECLRPNGIPGARLASFDRSQKHRSPSAPEGAVCTQNCLRVSQNNVSVLAATTTNDLVCLHDLVLKNLSLISKSGAAPPSHPFSSTTTATCGWTARKLTTGMFNSSRHRLPARLRCEIQMRPAARSSPISVSLKTRERMRKRTPSALSSENMPPRPGTTSSVSWVCFQYSN